VWYACLKLVSTEVMVGCSSSLMQGRSLLLKEGSKAACHI